MLKNYLLHCQRYIELNPVRANMVEYPADYRWSSYRANGEGHHIKLCTPHQLYLQLGKTLEIRTEMYRSLFTGQLDAKLVNEIRKATNQGMALGNERFKDEIEQLTGRRVVGLKPGPKLK